RGYTKSSSDRPASAGPIFFISTTARKTWLRERREGGVRSFTTRQNKRVKSSPEAACWLTVKIYLDPRRELPGVKPNQTPTTRVVREGIESYSRPAVLIC